MDAPAAPALPRHEAESLVALFTEYCDCAGLQPGSSGPRLDEHAKDCEYRLKAEMDYDDPSHS